ncbi:MAG: metallophosphoesterase family protein [candidate division KSB1 bacterium]|nr:metallophosphoesterase family protein [candidate division KSB1 bacterium]
MRHRIIIITLLLFSYLPLIANAQEHSTPKRIILTWEGNPATSQSVTWRTDHKTKNPVGQIIPLGPSVREYDQDAITVQAKTEELSQNSKSVFHHTVGFKDLKQNTRYAYRVGTLNTWSEWNMFRTAGSDTGTFSFIYLGDIQNEVHKNASILLRTAFAHASDARFILIAGDMTNHGYDDHLWHNFSKAFGFIPRMRPLVPVPGNHDKAKQDEGENSIRHIAPLYKAHFALPPNGPGLDALNETAYYIDYQCARFVIFNSMSDKNPQQLDWLKRTLKSNKKPWLIVSHHHPLYSTGQDRDNPELRKMLSPLYEKYGVDLVLQGHDHHYGRTHKIVKNQIVSNTDKGPVYVVSVSGPKMYSHNDKFSHLMKVEVGNTQLYQIITLNPEQLHYQSWSLDQRLIDEFKLKQSKKGTTLVEMK